MKIIRTFAIVEDSLYSVLYKSEINYFDENMELIIDNHEFKRLFNLWNDASQLRSFFEEHQKDLNDLFWKGMTIEDAIMKTRSEAKKLEKFLITIAKEGKENKNNTLSSIFKPLGINESKILERDKARINNGWLRIYAVRLDLNLFVVSGGAIKLRKTMNDRPYLENELKKLNATKQYLQEDENDLSEYVELYS